jgi:CelD/BcsL family acetyltransferase involved in cellulose biosynthesis
MLQLQEGFDPDYTPHVGNALRSHVINDCIAQGLREYDFLGGWSEHKRRWLARERSGADLLIAATRIKTLPIMLAGVWPTGAFLRPAR